MTLRSAPLLLLPIAYPSVCGTREAAHPRMPAVITPPKPPEWTKSFCAAEDRKPDLRLLSLGAGVQSSTLLYMVLRGDLPALDGVLFADTGWEPQAVYQHVETLQAQCAAANLPFYRVQGGHIFQDAFAPDRRFASLPLYVRNPDGSVGILRRQCTNEYKLRPIRRKVRELLGGRTRGKEVEMWLGISLEEAAWRIKPSRVRYIIHTYPLVDRRMTRHDCIIWLIRHGYAVPPKSACIGCPFHSDAQWRQLRDTAPDEWWQAVDFDRALRDGRIRLGKAGLTGQVYLHRSLLPLDQVDITTAPERGQPDLFNNECSGICGV